MNPASHKKEQDLLKLRCRLEKKYNKFVDTYRVNVNEHPITEKFYSKPPRDPDSVQQSISKVKKMIEKYKNEGPREKYPEPVLESHNFGWYPELVTFDRSDRRFYKPHKGTPLTTHGALVARDKTSGREKFTGVPFLLQ